MAELRKLTSRVWCLPGPVNIGIIKGPQGALLIDTGLDQGAARKILKAVATLSMEVVAIINTHAHADHYGGNREIVSKTGAKVYGPPLDDALIDYPQLEPMFFFSGAEPVKEMRVKFLQAEASPVHQVLGTGQQLVEGIELEVLPLPGHSPGQVGILCQGVLFTGDAYFPPDILVKHGIPLYVDLEAANRSFELLASMDCTYYVPGHGEIMESIGEVVGENRRYLEELSNEMLVVITESMASNQVLESICNRRGLNITNPVQYHLLNTAVLAHLSYLVKLEKAEWRLEHNRFIWQQKRRTSF